METKVKSVAFIGLEPKSTFPSLLLRLWKPLHIKFWLAWKIFQARFNFFFDIEVDAALEPIVSELEGFLFAFNCMLPWYEMDLHF